MGQREYMDPKFYVDMILYRCMYAQENYELGDSANSVFEEIKRECDWLTCSLMERGIIHD